MISPTLHTAGLAALELLINQTLRLDPAAQYRLQTLNGHVFHCQCSSPTLDIYVIPTDKSLRLCGYYEYPADTLLSGTANDFLALVTATDPANALINGQLTLTGDSKALIELQQIAKNLDLDWEVPLSTLFGDVGGHQLGKVLRNGFSISSQFLRSAQRQLSEYIREESDLVPPNWQVEQYYKDISSLRLRTERLEARIEKYRQRLAATKR